jgi:hypothetical protein
MGLLDKYLDYLQSVGLAACTASTAAFREKVARPQKQNSKGGHQWWHKPSSASTEATEVRFAVWGWRGDSRRHTHCLKKPLHTDDHADNSQQVCVAYHSGTPHRAPRGGGGNPQQGGDPYCSCEADEDVSWPKVTSKSEVGLDSHDHTSHCLYCHTGVMGTPTQKRQPLLRELAPSGHPFPLQGRSEPR